MLEHYPALLLIDGSSPDWPLWVASVKTEQATRRIPVLVLTPDGAEYTAIRASGADDYLLYSLPDETFLQHIREQARTLPPDLIERLECQCREELPPLAQLGVERFNQGAYYAQHDAFEEQWMSETGPVRNLYRAILQVGVAYYHITRGNHEGGLKMLRRCVQWFALLPDECQGVDVRQLREDAARVRAALQTMADEDSPSFDRALLKPVRLIEP
jgi:predicted metal-dependent hydrolase